MSTMSSSMSAGADSDCTEDSDLQDTVLFSAGGARLYLPSCQPERKPFEGKQFKTLNQAIDFYQNYGRLSGFTTRRYSEKVGDGKCVLIKYMVCSKQGHIAGQTSPQVSKSTKQRNRLLSRVNCGAMIRFTFVSEAEGYKVSKFIEGHNHPLVGGAHRHEMRGHRHMGDNHVEWMNHCERSGVGPSRAHRLLSETVGGPSHVGATKIDFYNYHRDLKAYIGSSDVQIILDQFRDKKVANSSFYYEYDVDTTGSLTKLFWCDEVAIKNYELYGDNVTFDTTYRTNQYSMPFCPFTGVDNYDKSVTFGLGLVTHEDIESFTWMFNAFLKAMKGKQPMYLVTDQDPAMKVAIPRVMTETKHKLCMWHILNKIRLKIPGAITRDTDFEKKLYSIVYNNLIKPAEFEEKWIEIITEFNLQENNWLNSIFDLRHSWIPAYHRDLPMGLFMRTTSRSESANRAYQHLTDQYLNLVHLIWRCGMVIENQRNEHFKLMMHSYNTYPVLKTNTVFEVDAWTVYTHTVFADIQKDIVYALNRCSLANMDPGDEMSIYKVKDSRIIKDGKEFCVTRTMSTDEFQCDCNRLLTTGCICSHIFFVLQTTTLKRIPRTLVAQRWCKDTDMTTTLSTEGPCLKDDEVMDAVKTRFNAMIETEDAAISSIRGLLDTLNRYRVKTVDDIIAETRMSRTRHIASVTGIKLPELVEVQVPNITNTKGSRLRSGSRMIPNRDKAINEGNKRKRLCRTCNTLQLHDTRTCPLNKNKKKKNNQ